MTKIQSLTKQQAIIVSAYTGFLICKFSDMHKAVEDKLGYPVWTHQFGDKAFDDKIKEAFREDFLKLEPVEES